MLLVEQDIILVARIYKEANLGEMIPSKMDVAPHPLTMFKSMLNECPKLEINVFKVGTKYMETSTRGKLPQIFKNLAPIKTRPTLLDISYPVMESLEILETQTAKMCQK